MAEALSRESPLAGFEAGTDGRDPRIAERSGLGQINVRGVGGPSFCQAVEEALGLTPPEAGRAATAGPVTMLWLGPDEWLVVAEDGGATLGGSLRRALTGINAAITDVSDARAVIRLSGCGAGDVLAKGCTLDLHPRVFGPGHVVQSTLARVDVILVQVSGDGDLAFDIHVGRSFAEYLWLWLEDARRNFHACR
jgi:sarcosine oxidase subunit gamma